jgi:hypothetical protein
MPVIPSYGKLRSGRSKFQATSDKKACEIPLQQKKLGYILAHISHPSNGEKYKMGRLRSKPTWAKSKTLSPK